MPLQQQGVRVVSFHEKPFFDVLTEQPSPFVGFGPPIIMESIQLKEFFEDAAEARCRLEEGFSNEFMRSSDAISAMEAVIIQMWEDGWNPTEGDLTLFVVDFGLALTGDLYSKLGGSLVLRSRTDLMHGSLWWKDRAIEAFPFHKVYKRLSSKEGDSLILFQKGLKSLFTSKAR